MPSGPRCTGQTGAEAPVLEQEPCSWVDALTAAFKPQVLRQVIRGGALATGLMEFVVEVKQNQFEKRL